MLESHHKCKNKLVYRRGVVRTEKLNLNENKSLESECQWKLRMMKRRQLKVRVISVELLSSEVWLKNLLEKWQKIDSFSDRQLKSLWQLIWFLKLNETFSQQPISHEILEISFIHNLLTKQLENQNNSLELLSIKICFRFNYSRRNVVISAISTKDFIFGVERKTTIANVFLQKKTCSSWCIAPETNNNY